MKSVCLAALWRAVAIAGLVTFAASGCAADRRGRLVLDVKIESRDRLANGMLGETSSGSSSQSLRLAATLRTDGKLEKTNRNDRSATAATAKGEARFLAYRAQQDCESDMHARIQATREGVLADSERTVPFTEKTNADYHATAGDKLLLLCPKLNDLVMDVGKKTIHVTLGDPPINGTVTRIERGRVPFTAERPSSDLRLHADAMAWVRQQLQGAPRSGQARTTLQVASKPGETGTRSGTVDVQLSWRFDDL